MKKLSFGYRLFSVAVIPLVGVLSFLSKAPDPGQALQQFVNAFIAGNAAGLKEIIHPEVMTGKEIQTGDVEKFLQRFHHGSLVLEESKIDKRIKSEDDKTERFQATVVFQEPAPGPQYAGPSRLTMVLLWALEDDRWWLERPLSICLTVNSTEKFPTDRQRESAMQFETACGVLERIGVKDDKDLDIIGKRAPGAATNEYVELEQLHQKERNKRGIDPDSRGVDLLIRAAGKEHGGFLQVYHGDFKEGPKDKRRPMPWEVLRDYGGAALERGKTQEKRMNAKAAQRIYRQVIAVGRQLIDEPGGYSFVNWGLTFQKQGAEALARVLPPSAAEEKARVSAFANLVSRRLDSLQTALGCLDDLADYHALEAAISASQRTSDTIFRPWALNTLAILSLKGAPAGTSAMQSAGGLLLVINPAMQKLAATRLDELITKEGGRTKEFIDAQREWVQTHNVYGESHGFK